MAERLGFGYEELKAVNPNLIYISITGFGSSGPYQEMRCYDQVTEKLV